MLISTTRRALGLTSTELARQAHISRPCLYRIETGKRRTRRSTLTRIAEALAAASTHLDVRSLVDDLVNLAGPALAEESPYAERVARRRQQRVEAQQRRQARQEAQEAERWFWEQRLRQRARFNAEYLARLHSNNFPTRSGRLPKPRPLPDPVDYGLPADTSPPTPPPWLAGRGEQQT